MIEQKLHDLWKFSIKLKDTDLSLHGHSRGSEKSCFYIPELKTFLDAGCDSYFNPDYIFITHCHSDHSFQLPKILTGLDRTDKNPPQIYAPTESSELFNNFLNATYKLRKHSIKIKGHFVVRGASPKMEIDLNKNGYFVRVYNLHHNVPTRGYGICQTRKKINPIYTGLNGKELQKLKHSGIDINYYVTYNVVAYVLDTTIECFDTNPELLNYRNVIIECTFFLDESEDVTEKHIHWRDLKKIVIDNPKVHFILVHFSMRYTLDNIVSFFEQENIDNITVWIN